MVGAATTGYLVTLVERVTRFTLTGWSRTKEADEVASVIIRLLAAIGIACTGITLDNGKEFARHAEIAAALKANVFFARPYHSWERGTNGNTNGLIRRLFPKSESFAAIVGEEIKRIDTFLNDRPRKCLGWKTPREVMAAPLCPCGTEPPPYTLSTPAQPRFPLPTPRSHATLTPVYHLKDSRTRRPVASVALATGRRELKSMYASCESGRLGV